MNHRRIQSRFIQLVAITGVAFGIAACGGSSDADDDPTATAVAAVNTPVLDQALVTQGETLFAQFNCAQCHSVSGGQSTGPALNALFGSERKLASGDAVLADDAYIQESILNPNVAIVEGYPSAVMAAAMSNLQGDLSEPETIAALVEYIKSLPASGQ